MKCVNCKKKFDEIKYDYLCTHCGSYNAKKITNIEEGERKSSFFKQIFTIISAMLTVVTICSFVWNLVFEAGTAEPGIVESAPEPLIKQQIAEGIEKEEQVETLVLEYDENGFLVAEGVLLEYIGTDRYVTIPSDVKVISTGVFRGNEAIETVILNEGLEVIEEEAFYECAYLEMVHFPSTLLKIEAFAFSDCDQLTSADLKEGLIEVGDSAFFGCEVLSNITIPTSLERVHGDAFDVNPWYYENHPFYGDFIIGDGILNSMYTEFTDKKLVLPSGIRRISTEFTYINSYADEIIIPDGVHTIMEFPFGGFGQDGDFTVEIPDSVTQIDGELYQIMFNGENNITVRCSEGSYAYDYALEYGYKIEIR